MEESIPMLDVLEGKSENLQPILKLTRRNNIVEALGELFGFVYELQFEDEPSGVQTTKHVRTFSTYVPDVRKRAMSRLHSYIIDNNIHRSPGDNFGTLERAVKYLQITKVTDPDNEIRHLAADYLKDVLNCNPGPAYCSSCFWEYSCPLHNPDEI